MIADEAVQRLVRQCIGFLSETDARQKNKFKQFFRGITPRKWKNNKYPGICCRRHMLVFEKLDVIPEYCFDCYKIFIEPHSVVELFKLMMLFEAMELPEDNTRKCMVETRPDISGTYKGYIYFQNLEDAQSVFAEVKALVREQVSAAVPVSIKRGCSEYVKSYPEYGKVGNEAGQPMTYLEAWRDKEKYADEHLIGHLKPQNRESYNPVSPGFTRNDALVMYAWLEYAQVIGDASYRSIAEIPPPTGPAIRRPGVRGDEGKD